MVPIETNSLKFGEVRYAPGDTWDVVFCWFCCFKQVNWQNPHATSVLSDIDLVAWFTDDLLSSQVVKLRDSRDWMPRRTLFTCSLSFPVRGLSNRCLERTIPYHLSSREPWMIPIGWASSFLLHHIHLLRNPSRGCFKFSFRGDSCCFCRLSSIW